MLKSFVSKLFSFALAGVLIFAVAGCGDEDEDNNTTQTVNGVVIDEENGEVVSSAEARAFFAELETEQEEITAQSVMKYTYSMKFSGELTSGESYSMTAGSRYSKEDNYLYTWVQLIDQPLYDYDELGSVVGKIGTCSSHSGVYAYIDSEGKAIEAIHSSYHGSSYTEGAYSDSLNEWAYLCEDEQTEMEAFEENCFSEILEVMAVLLDYEEQMAMAIESMTLTDIQIPGIAIQSKGKGHLYVTMEMLGMFYAIEYTNYHLSYMKMTMDSTIDPTIKSMTVEMSFKVGECVVSYPDLSTYTYNPDAITPNIDMDIDSIFGGYGEAEPDYECESDVGADAA